MGGGDCISKVTRFKGTGGGRLVKLPAVNGGYSKTNVAGELR